jgi:hypothetical protein
MFSERGRSGASTMVRTFLQGAEAMNTTLGLLLIGFLNIVALACYYTLFGVRREVIETKTLLQAELSEIHKLLASKANKA